MLCQPRSGDFSRWTDRLVQFRSLFVHISGSSGVLDGCLPEGNGHLPCNPLKKTFNGWRSTSFPERSGVQQGSPLSPLLYVLAAQPLASHLRRQCQLGVIRPITMPDGQPAPVSHQHADDTSLHVLFFFFFFFFWDAQVALDTSIGLFCAASCSQLNAGKSQAFLVQAQPLASATVSTLPSISFITGQQTIKHLGVSLGYDMPAACHQTFTGIYQAIRAKVRHWSARGLSFSGRVHVAKQVCA
ncbi:hypothetical protein ABBQ32_012668 [Trebouxia sp. C0010 RCD-2024]